MASLSPIREESAFIARSEFEPEDNALYISSKNAADENQTICPSLEQSMDKATANGPSTSSSYFSYVVRS